MAEETVVETVEEATARPDESTDGSLSGPAVAILTVLAVIAIEFIAWAIHDAWKKPETTSTGLYVTAASTSAPTTVIYRTEDSSDDDDPGSAKWTTPPKNAPPSVITIGPHTYTVKYRRMGPLGQTDEEKSILWLRNNLSRSQLRETLLHEVMHASIGVGNWYRHVQGEDSQIESVAPVLLMVLRDNPALVKWLGEKS